MAVATRDRLKQIAAILGALAALAGSAVSLFDDDTPPVAMDAGVLDAAAPAAPRPHYWGGGRPASAPAVAPAAPTTEPAAEHDDPPALVAPLDEAGEPDEADSSAETD